MSICQHKIEGGPLAVVASPRSAWVDGIEVMLLDLNHQIGIFAGYQAVRLNLPKQISKEELAMLLHEAADNIK